MTERDRIHILLEEGKLSQEDADLLLEALSEIDEAESEMDKPFRELDQAEDAAPSSTPASPFAPSVDTSNRTVAPEPPPAPHPPEPPFTPSASAPSGLHWVHLRVRAGNLRVSVDPNLTAPVVEGKAVVVAAGDDFEVRSHRQPGTSGLEGLIDLIGQVAGNVEVRIPEGYGLHVESFSGDVNIKGVPYLKGRLTSGDITARDIGGLDIVMVSGDIDLSARLTEGEHRLKATSGDITLTLLAGSSVRVSGKATSGDITLPDPLRQTSGLVRKAFEGVVGDGAARLDLQLVSGDVSIEVLE